MPSQIQGTLRGPLGGRIARQRDNREVEAHRQQVMLRNLEALDRSLNIREKVESTPLKRKKRQLETLSTEHAIENFDKTMAQKAEADQLELQNARLVTAESKKEYLAEAIPSVTSDNFQESFNSWESLGINVDSFRGLSWGQVKPLLDQMREASIRDLPFERQQRIRQEEIKLRKELATFKHGLKMKQLERTAELKGSADSKTVKIEDLVKADVEIAQDRLLGELGEDHPLIKDTIKFKNAGIALASASKYKKDTTGISQEEAYKQSLDDMYAMGLMSVEEETEEGWFSSIKGWFTGLSSSEPVASSDFNQQETEKALGETQGQAISDSSINETGGVIVVKESDLQ